MSEGRGGNRDIQSTLHQQTDLVGRHGGKRQQGRRSEMLERHRAVDMGEEIDRHGGADAFLVAKQEDSFELREAPAVDGKDDLVDHMFAQDGWQFGNRMDLVGGGQDDFGGASSVSAKNPRSRTP